MAAPILQSIMLDVETAIGGIKIASGYQNSVAHVQRVQQTVTSIATLPAALIILRDIRRTDQEPYGVQDWTASVEIEVVFTADPTESAFERDLSGNVTELTDVYYSAWFSDINKALLADRTRGGYAIDTQITGMEPLPVSTEERLAGIIVDAEITYRHRYGDATVAI